MFRFSPRRSNSEPCTHEENEALFEASALPDPLMLMFYNNLEERIIWLDSKITADSLGIVRYIQHFNREDQGIPVDERKPIRLMIHTSGGDLDISFSIVDAILTSVTPVHTINMGSAASGGFIILIAGTKRFCTQHSSAMVHPGSAQFSGTFDQFRTFASDYARTVEDMKAYILSHSHLNEENLSRLWGADMYLSSEEQLQCGVVDEIISQNNRAVLL